MKVLNFMYNGFIGRTFKGYAPYTAKFVEWTNDPGIVKCMCSDCKERLIPTFALVEFKEENYPKQEYINGIPNILGLSSKS